MFGLGLESWEHLMLAALAAAALAAIAVGLATYVVIKLQREAALDSARQIAQLEVRASEATAEAASATERAAKAALELAKFKAPRSLSPEQQQRIADKLRPHGSPPFDFSIQADAEPVMLMEQIASMLQSAGWVWEPARDAGVVFTLPGKPPAGIVAFAGLEIQIAESQRAAWGQAVVALRDALIAEGIAATALGDISGSVNPRAIHIKIGRKP